MTREEAIDNLSVAFGSYREEVSYQIAAIGQLETQKRKFDEAIKQLNFLAKRQFRQTRQSNTSPYAKFDKYHKKKRK